MKDKGTKEQREKEQIGDQKLNLGKCILLKSLEKKCMPVIETDSV